MRNVSHRLRHLNSWSPVWQRSVGEAMEPLGDATGKMSNRHKHSFGRMTLNTYTSNTKVNGNPIHKFLIYRSQTVSRTFIWRSSFVEGAQATQEPDRLVILLLRSSSLPSPSDLCWRKWQAIFRPQASRITDSQLSTPPSSSCSVAMRTASLFQRIDCTALPG